MILSFKHFDLHATAAEIDQLRRKALRPVTQHDAPAESGEVRFARRAVYYGLIELAHMAFR